jgi:hypothetical protein
MKRSVSYERMILLTIVFLTELRKIILNRLTKKDVMIIIHIDFRDDNNRRKEWVETRE